MKLPVTTTRGEPLFNAVRSLSRDGVKVNLTAIFTAEQAASGVAALAGGAPACVRCSPGVSPMPASITGRSCAMRSRARAQTANVEIIWASTREVFNVIEADEMGCHIITAPAAVLKKLPALGNRRRAPNFARRGKGVPRGCRVGRADASGCRVARGRVTGRFGPTPR